MTSLLVSLHLLMGSLLIVAVAMPVSTAIAQSPKPKRIVWTGFWEHKGVYKGPLGLYRNVHKRTDDYKVQFKYVLETDARGGKRWIERKITWKAYNTSRYGSYFRFCEGNGSVDLGSALGDGTPDDFQTTASPEVSNGSIKLKCNDSGFRYGALIERFVEPPNEIDVPGIVSWEKLRKDKDGNPCTYRENVPYSMGDLSTDPATAVASYSVSVSPEIDAVMEVKTDDRSEYWRFVPKPRGKIWFSAHSNIPVRFRFKLEEVSKFPGYTTNAYVDKEFFKRYTLEHLQGKYPKGLPDLIFDPRDFEDREVWKKPTGDALDMVETVKERTSTQLAVPVTALDYGAYGRLRAWAIDKCGGEQPVKILVGGKERELLKIPMDEDDNLIADRMDKEWGYKGDPGRDDDQEPKGNGIKGDGLTAFEEYRGFMRSDGYCSEPLKDVHFRTNPNKKDLFIAPDNKKLADAAGKFGYNSGLDVHLICPRHYFNNNTRIVNFTLQRKGAWRPSGKTVTQKEPQHGLYLIVDSAPGVVGEQYGPPKYVRAVAVDPLFAETLYGAIAEAGRMPFFEDKLVLESAVLHELGHAVGIRHHGPDVTPVILDFPSCPPGQDDVIEGTVNGKRACWSSDMIAPHGVTSGNQDCPMRFTNNIVPKWYVTPSSTPVGPAVIQYKDSEGNLNQFEGTGYRGHVKKYRVELERPGVGKFCSSTKGTGINALPGDQNHAGDSRRVCAEQICVNDLKCPTVTP